MSYKILSFCGGGIRGLWSTGILNRIYQQNPDIISADLLAGTSTGSDIISLLLAGKTTDHIYNSYVNDAPFFFRNPDTDPTSPAYSVFDLVAAQRLLHPFNPQLSSLDQKVLFTSFNVGSDAQNIWQPILFSNLSNPPCQDASIVDAVVSSSTMPGMFGSHNGNVDGAFVNHDPTLAAIAAAVNSGVKLDDIVVLCIGTGFMPNWIASDTSTWGAQQWQTGDGNSKSQLPPLLINGTTSPILNISLTGTSTNLIPMISGMMLGPRYCYLNPVLDRIIPENDTDPDDLAYLQALVNSYDIADALTFLKTNW